MPRHLTPGTQRLADRMNDVPFGIYDATWTLLSWNRPWASLMGDPGAARGRDRNLVWLYFTGAALRIQHSDPGQHEEEIVADLREAASRYPADEELAALVRDLRGVSERFAARWEQPAVTRIRGERKTVRNPVVGDITLDCDVLTVHGNDLRVVVFTAAPGTPDADKLAMLTIVGEQDFSGSGTE